ncbi:MAG TPA: beta-propeller fold lactonase family protein [Candidatus Cybelea sp.]|nr:beta-propeller fold lactonase family protein [Candidatus Cybelea sp.]
MRQTQFVVRTLSALGLAALFAACSNSGLSGTITPSGVAPDSQSRPAAVPNHTAKDSVTTIVANYGSNNVSVYTVNVKTGALTQVKGSPFGAGTEPFGATIIERTEDAIFAYVTNEGSNDVSAYKVNPKSGALTQVSGSPFEAGSGPAAAAWLESQGGWGNSDLFVTNTGSDNISVYKVNAKTGALTQVKGSPFAAGSGPTSVTGVENGGAGYLYVTNIDSNNVSAYNVNPKTGALTQVKGSPFAAGTEPDGVADYVPNGSAQPAVYVANYGSDNVSAYTVNRKTGALTQASGSPFAAGTGPFGVACCYHPKGSSLPPPDVYVANQGSNNISAYSVSGSGGLTPVYGSPFAAGSGPTGVGCIVVNDGSTYLYATNSGSNNVSGYAIDASSGALTQVTGSPFAAGTEPYGLAAKNLPKGVTC